MWSVLKKEESRLGSAFGIVWEAQKRGPLFKVVNDLLDSFLLLIGLRKRTK